MNTNHLIRTLCILFAIALAAPAQTNNNIVRQKGQGSVAYSGKKKPKDEIARVAIIEAKKDALQRYVARFNTARRANYEKVAAEIQRRLEDVVPNANLLDEGHLANANLWSVIIEAGIDDNLIEQIIQADSAKERASAGGGGKSESYITFVFVARELESAVSFDEKRTVVANAETEKRGATTAAAEGDAVSISNKSGSTSVTQTGGSTERKAEQRKYRVFTVGEVDAAVNNVLTTAGYEVVSAVDADLKMNDFKRDYETGDIQPETRREAVKNARGNEISYLGTASMDVGLPQKDPATGMFRVYITVNSQVSDLRKRLPKTVVSIAGKAYAGLGPDEQVARTNALNTAAKEMAAELVDQLRLKTVQ
jgi:uncharacterized protein YdbL (DUF1318 family)